MSGPFVICDLRAEWRRNPYVTFWRPDNAGYAYPLGWAGDYSEEAVTQGGRYYTAFENGELIRFAAPRSAVEAFAIPPNPKEIDGDAGPVVPNTAAFRKKLRKLALLLALQEIEK